MFSSIRKLSLVFLVFGVLMFVGCSQEPDTLAPGSQESDIAIKTIPAGYYDTVNASSAATLRTTLHDVIDDHTKIPYTSTATDTWNVLELADEDPNDSGRILDLYMNESYPKYGAGNNDYNREHTWPSSYGFTSDGSSNYPYTDCHHLFLCNDSYNSSRGNKPYSTVGGTGTTEKPTVANDGVGGGSGTYPGWSNWYDVTYWETWWDRRGDVARALMYLDVRYEGGTHGGSGYSEPDLILTDNLTLIENSNTGSNESVAYMGLLADLLQWHNDDPVDAKEINRNDQVYTHQGNRNPFIDHPEWVDCLFNDVCGGGDTTPPAAPTGLAATAAEGSVSLDWNDNGESDLAGYTVYRGTSSGGPYNAVNGTLLTVSQFDDTGLTGGTTYWYVVTASDNSANESASSNEASATPTGGGGGPEVWINEFHYDNDGTDTGEFFEIAGTAGTSLASWQVIGYNGNGGVVYDTENLSGTLPDQSNGFGTLSFPMAGMQNGSPDGLALIDDGGGVVMFISYEGVITAVDGPAAGLTSTDIGVSEPTDSPVGWSLQLAGDGTTYGAFTWQSPAAETSGAVNTGQTFGAPVNQNPVAEANGPYAALTGAPLAFSSAGSNDPDGTIDSYLWDFGDGGTSTQANPSYTYTVAGNYTVTLTVTDNLGAEGSDTAAADITAPNQAPVAEANGPYSGLTGSAVAFSSAGSNDSDGTIVSYLWTFGDGGTSTEANPSYTYAAAGSYTVTLTVTDNDGAEGSDNAAAEINDPVVGDPEVWINEFHYDNDGADKNEFVEVAGTAGTDLTGWTVAGYNGADGTVYMTVGFAGTLADQMGGFGTQAVEMVGMQNGSPDGLALVDGTGTVIQFLSYEGSFTATDGPAAGMTATDIGISEPADATRRTSLQLAGTGSAYADFYWEGGLGKTDGSVNVNQVFSGTGGDTTPPAAPTGLAATAGDGTVALDWADNGEGDLDGYTVYRSTSSGGPYTALNGSLLTASTYDDNTVTNGTTYYYVVTASDLTGNESADSGEVNATPEASGGTTPMHVASITLSTTVVRNKEYGHAAVLVVDDLGAPVAGATVTGTFAGDIPGSDSAVTGADGVANLTSPKAAKPTITFTFCVDNITLSGYTYDSGANVETCDTH
ncbi:MAG: PKD domain-containing protein [Candidatus Krumholzibacteriota bacterium]